MDNLELIIAQYGYYAIYGLLTLGIVGLPVPDEMLMILIGYLSSTHVLNLCDSIVVAFLGTMTGMLFSFFLGNKVGKPLLLKYGKWIRLTPQRLEKVEKWFKKYGPWTIVFGYYIPGVRHLTCYMAGVIGIKFRHYVVIAAIGAFIWCCIFISVGYFGHRAVF
ncbi:DedA family protein [Paenibacillus radicis (ex Gao et al. 2016)]|uniref:Membrane protein YbfM n=1 Tax=Paenibacillus radicis (ex Gao et al. 2016) TaxID=1737354 RepID=A0A917HHJ2_9BACL|nr:DedA family protein [Paenibacillus radicis (ex Gao et al. 2016)]GGG78832.1 putative membrane protein YbfM [Paenibacillus radicis (ex Gao et al. 2016)]